MRFTLAFGLVGVALATQAIRLAGKADGLWWLLVTAEVYAAICFLSLATIYGLQEAGFAIEDFLLRPVWPRVVPAVLLPYLILGSITLYIARWFDREGQLNLVAPGLYVGRLPFPSELHKVRAFGVEAVLNLCWEFPRLSGVDGEPGIETARVPILDGSPPSDRQFREAVEWCARWRAEGRSVLIHCAQGHGRTATVTAAILLKLGLASDVQEALSLVRRARPLAKPSSRQKAALIRYASGDPPRQY